MKIISIADVTLENGKIEVMLDVDIGGNVATSPLLPAREIATILPKDILKNPTVNEIMPILRRMLLGREVEPMSKKDDPYENYVIFPLWE